MMENLEEKNKELEASIKVLEEENAIFAERAEDILLLGQVAESISNLEVSQEILDVVLERVSILKDIPYCACCALVDDSVHVVRAYDVFREDSAAEDQITLSPAKIKDLSHGAYIVSDGECRKKGVSISLAENDFSPWTVAVIPFTTRTIPQGFFLFADENRTEDRLSPMIMLLQRTVEMTVDKLNNISLIQDLRQLTAELDQKVEERTAELQASEARYQDLYDNAPDMFVSVNAKTSKIIQCNQTLATALGKKKVEIIDRPLFEIYHPDCLPLVRKTFKSFSKSGELRDAELKLQRKDGGSIDVSLNVSAVRDELGEILHSRSILRDITERKRAEEELVQAAREWQTTFDATNDAIWILDQHQRILRCNKWAERLFQRPGRELIGKHCWEIMHGTTPSIPECPFLRAQHSLRRETIELQIGEGWFQITVDPILDAEGGLAGAVHNVSDITERKLAEEALLLSRKHYETLFNDSPVPLWEEEFAELYVYLEELKKSGVADFRAYFDKNPTELQKCAQKVKIMDVNQATLKLHHAKNKEELLDNLDKIFTEKSFDVFKEELIALASGQVEFESEAEVKTLTGEPKYIFLKLKIEKDQPHLKKALLATTDITERVRAEEELQKYQQQLEKMVQTRTAELQAANKELEAFAYSVSHDLRAPLRAIDGFTRILMEDYAAKLDAEGKRLGSVIQQNSQKMGQLIDDLLAFSRTGRTAMHFSDINMKNMVNAIYHEVTSAEERKRINLSITDLPKTKGDPNMMRQVWMNLISNAVKFSAHRRIAVISVACRKEENKLTYFIKDNGAGFDMKYKDKLFGIFQRLHSEKEFAGTGVGLALVQRIIHRHGGQVWAEGKVDKGAAFYFSLPIIGH